MFRIGFLFIIVCLLSVGCGNEKKTVELEPTSSPQVRLWLVTTQMPLLKRGSI